MCKSNADCSRGETCTSGTCTKTARSRRLIASLVALGLGIAVALASGCAPSAAQLREAGLWVVRAELACGSPCKDAAPKACVNAVLAAAAPESGRAEYNTAAAACALYRGEK